ncbi:carboxypeptidase-like regulatory domain-containing protein [Stieleria sedimenti]|uniref:carboxypeptidase-like regulatory domain-containing protein n=1 Tax=Stieleria sedimenti TaxID=2976331 RepID=UPI00217FAE08|nr:carboxypeptidase-like regulatory domain-containing protein [Stieleria sedimenti]
MLTKSDCKINGADRLPFATALVLAMILLTTGCNSPPQPNVTATGTVHVAGEPLSGAVITLEPMRQTTGPNASAPVFDGRFEVPASAGLHGGTYRVRVAMIPTELLVKLPSEQAASLPPAGAVIDPSFDAESQLSCDLKPDQPNALAFAVEFLK